MGLEGGGPIGIGVGVDVVHVVFEGHLGVDKDPTVFGQQDDHIGLGAAAIAIGDAELKFIVAVGLEAGGFEEPLEGQFAPMAEHFVVAFEGFGEMVGLLADVAALVRQEFDLLLEGAALLDIGEVDILDLFAEIGDTVAEGGEEGADGFAVLGGESTGVVLEDLGGEDLELAEKLLAGGL